MGSAYSRVPYIKLYDLKRNICVNKVTIINDNFIFDSETKTILEDSLKQVKSNIQSNETEFNRKEREHKDMENGFVECKEEMQTEVSVMISRVESNVIINFLRVKCHSFIKILPILPILYVGF